MELKKLIKPLSDNFKFIVIGAFLMGAIGVAIYYFVPRKYIATGSVVVSRAVEPSTGTEFSYEGYYAQLNARNYTETFIGLLESIDVRSSALKKVDLSVTGENLLKANRNVAIKRPAPQVILVQVKRDSSELAEDYWVALVSSAGEMSGGQNVQSGDPMLAFSTKSDAPVVYEEYRNVYLFALVGFLLGGFLVSFWLILKEYLK